MDLSGKYFIYDGVMSRQYGLVFAHVNTQEFTSMSGSVKSRTIYNRQEKRTLFVGDDFSGAQLKFTAEIVCVDQRCIDPYFVRDIEKWLFHQPDYCKLYLDNPDFDSQGLEVIDLEPKQLYLNCRFVNPEKIDSVHGRIGYRFTIECDSAMAWQDPVCFQFDLSGSNKLINVPVDTDTNDYVYPKVTIKMGSTGGDIQILNLTDDAERQTAFRGLSPNITFSMHGDGVNYISGGNYAKFSERNFIRLLDGENDLRITGDVASITVEFQNQRYL